MLDLSATYNTKLYDVRLFDGTELHLKRPTQALQQYIIDLQGRIDASNPQEAMDCITDLFIRVMNRNNANTVYTAADFDEEYDFTIISAVITDYFAYWSAEVANSVDFLNTQQ